MPAGFPVARNGAGAGQALDFPQHCATAIVIFIGIHGVHQQAFFAVGPESGEWCQQLTLAIRAAVPVEVLRDVIQPYPTFSEAVFFALRELPL